MNELVTVGEIVAGKYRVERIIARGGMGVVLLATHVQLGEPVAMKLLLPEVASNADASARFLREAQAAARLKNEHIARVFDIGTTEQGRVYLVMEYLEGVDLDQAIRARGRLPIGEVIDYVVQACEGVAEAHRSGIIHRDIKPANLFLVRRSDGSQFVKLLDFGISKQPPTGLFVAEASTTKTSTVLGSPLYMSPEQLRSTRSVDTRSDVWSLGIVLYEAITGKSPFAGETYPDVCARILTGPIPAMPPDTPREIQAIIGRCLTKDPAGRFATVADLALALRPFAPLEAQIVADRVVRILQGAKLPLSNSAAGLAPAVAPGGTPQQATAVSFTANSPHPVRAASPIKVVFAAMFGLLGFGVVVTGGYVVYRSLARPSPELSAEADSGGPQPAAASSDEGPPRAATDRPIAPVNDAPLVTPPPLASASASATGASSVPVPKGRPPTGGEGPILPRSQPKSKTGAFGGRD